MLSSLKQTFKSPRGRHERIQSQEDITQLSYLTATPYSNPAGSSSQEYFDRPTTPGRYDPLMSQSSHHLNSGDTEGDDHQPLTGDAERFRRGVRDDYMSPRLPPLKKKAKSGLNWAFWGKIAFCFVAVGLYAYFVFAYVSAEVNPRPRYKSSETWRTPMIIFGLISGTAILLLFCYPWVAKRFKPSQRISMTQRQHRSNRQLVKTGLGLIPFVILLPFNFALTPNLIASAIAEKAFNNACNGWETTFELNSIPNGDPGSIANGNLLSYGRYAGPISFQGGEAGWRVSYSRDPTAPDDFDDKNITQIAFNSDGIGQSFTTLCNAINDVNATADTTDCTTGSSISFIMYNQSSDVSMFVSEEVPVVSLLFTPPAMSYSANYSKWEEDPPLGWLYDQDMNVGVKVVRKGSRNECNRPIKVCGQGVLQGYVSMAYVWRRWQEWGMGAGGCGTWTTS